MGHTKQHTQETDWDVMKTFKAAHGIMKKSPARRADYLHDNEIEVDDNDQAMKAFFPMSFSGTRWLENGKALERFLEINDKLGIFLSKSQEEGRENFDAKDERFPLLLSKTKSKIFEVYCEFSLSVCRNIEPFLTLFQAERPLAVFLYAKLREVILSLMGRFVKTSVIESNANNIVKLIKTDLPKEENLLDLDTVDIGFGAKKILRKFKTVEKPMERAFRSDVRNFLACLLEKLFDRCPLQYPLTRAISSLSPIEIKDSQKVH